VRGLVLIPIPIFILFFLVNGVHGFLGGDLTQQNDFLLNEKDITQPSGILKVSPLMHKNYDATRFLVFGSGTIENVKSITNKLVYSVNSQDGFFSLGVFSKNEISKFKSKGYYVIEDFPLDFHSSIDSKKTIDVSRIGEITGSEKAFQDYGYTGKGIKIAIVDTGVDFSNPDIQNSLARDKNNIPIMLDADGQGIVLTNATFIANIDENQILRKYTKDIPYNVTSSVYMNRDGVFLDINQEGKGTSLLVYNSFFPRSGLSPIFNGTLTDDMKIGQDNRDFILSRSGIYHLGIIYQGSLQGPSARIQVVPVLVVDSKIPGVYDTIIPDMSTSWIDFTRFELKQGEKPDYDFDFTDEIPITLGSGKEFLVYDFDDDGKNDYSAGTVGAQVLDIYGVVGGNKTQFVDKTLKAVNGTLLPPLDAGGTFFGVMTDFMGHGTSSAASITSEGKQEYDIYNNTKKYTIRGSAPGAQIVPVKALWFGDTVYASLWAAGLSNQENNWVFEGQPRVDIISNSWGVSNFPSLQFAPGLDVLSLIQSILTVPGSFNENYPGVTIISSAGNSGHGYGTLGLPNAAPYGITVGATTNNAFVGYGSFAGEPRFGNTTDHFNHVVDFSSRGPGIIGDPKPDLMSIGAYSFTPSTITKMRSNSTAESFSMFGGTSMAAPLVSGVASILMESLKEKNEDYDPMRIKNILMSTASDLQNDPLTQGAGLVNAYDAVKFVNGKDGKFIVHNDKTFSNIKKVLTIPIASVNSSIFGVENFQLPIKDFPQTSWFGGRLSSGERSTTTFTIENPTDRLLEISVTPQVVKLIKQNQLNSTTDVQQQDPVMNKSGIYIPNYLRLADVRQHEDLGSFFDETNPIPPDSSLMVLNANFAFEDFMNKTDDVYANDLKIASLYVYDWNDKNNDTKIASEELSMVNRGGSWGTVQEIRVSDPVSKFEDIPLVGIYPVPTRYSYWMGNTGANSTSMDYSISASFYKKDKWDQIWLDNNIVQVPPSGSATVTATIVVPPDYQSGIYQGFVKFQSKQHTVNVPVTFAVKKVIDKKDSLIVISGIDSKDTLYGNGFVKGAFDMVNRYMAGDWRQYYFEIKDRTINTAAIDISWENDDSNLSAFMIDPTGKIIQTNVPSGVFGHFMDWPSLDWLGLSPFSQGGGFYPVKNKNPTSTVLYAPINQTGTYSLLLHSTLFDGKNPTEPITVTAKFTTILPDNVKPTITLTLPEFINDSYSISPEIIDDNINNVFYYLDGMAVNFTESGLFNATLLEEGIHKLEISVSDSVGNNAVETFVFKVDNSPPTLNIKSPKNGTTISKSLSINFDIHEPNLPENGTITIFLPNGETIQDKTSVRYDTSQLAEGEHQIEIMVQDKAGNKAQKLIFFNVDPSATVMDTILEESQQYNQTSTLIIGVGIGIAIMVIAIFALTKKNKISLNH